MKKHYLRDMEDFWSFYGLAFFPNRRKFRYEHRHAYMWRQPKIAGAIRQACYDKCDGIPIRHARVSTLPETWDDRTVARNYGKSWKDYTKRRHQWEGR